VSNTKLDAEGTDRKKAEMARMNDPLAMGHRHLKPARFAEGGRFGRDRISGYLSM